MTATLVAGGARHVSDSTSSVDDQREFLRRRPNPKPRSIVPVEEEIVVQRHASIGALRSLEVSARGGEGPGSVGRGEDQGEDHGSGVGGDVGRGRDAEPGDGDGEEQPQKGGDGGGGGSGGRADRRRRHWMENGGEIWQLGELQISARGKSREVGKRKSLSLSSSRALEIGRAHV